MPRYKLTIEYDGTPFSGWQKQGDTDMTVQTVLEAAIEQFIGEKAETVVAGRTDAGVHARGQVAHVDFPMERASFNIRQGLNTFLLPHPISVLEAEEVPADFSARMSATRRHYLYRIINRSSRLALDETRAWHVHESLDIDKMNEAAQFLIGHHDFTSFRASACQSKSPIKTLDMLEVKRRSTNPEQIMVRVNARSFLHHQVRNMVGTLMLVGSGKWKPVQVKEALEARDRSASGPTAPAHGLYLMKVDY